MVEAEKAQFSTHQRATSPQALCHHMSSVPAERQRSQCRASTPWATCRVPAVVLAAPPESSFPAWSNQLARPRNPQAGRIWTVFPPAMPRTCEALGNAPLRLADESVSSPPSHHSACQLVLRITAVSSPLKRAQSYIQSHNRSTPGHLTHTSFSITVGNRTALRRERAW